MTDLWRPLTDELDRWQREGRQVRLWLRDDDAVAATPALDRLAAVAARFELPVLLAVIPCLAEPSLAARLQGERWLLPCQHGCRHFNHAGPADKKSEFGLHRPLDEIAADIARARDRLMERLNGAWLPVFVPPWNRIATEVAALLPGLGFAGLSCFRNDRPSAAGGLRVVNTDIDIMDWHGGRIGRPAEALIAEICGVLQRQRANAVMSPDPTLGMLLHHRDHDETAWRFIADLLAVALCHPAVGGVDPRVLFLADAG